MNADSQLQSAERVLSTLESDGSRRWLKPRVSRGRLLTARRVVAYFLIAVFFLLPFLKLNGKPLILLDIVHRQFTLFGYTFLPTDTLLLALFMLGVFIAIFLMTALFGRVWCGWACPQTVYLEFIYRPLERLFDGTIGRGGKAGDKIGDWRPVAYFFAALAVTILPAHTFLAYFVGVDQLSQWVRQSPFQHPTSFLVMLGTTALMLFDFYYFREQLCIVACPYGRFQSVLLDRFSLIVSYDRQRGEPRGKRTEKGITGNSPRAVPETIPDPFAARGDCIDCGLCVSTCPTGIDIRQGLQLECVNCAQCIDACNAVMDKIGTPRGLIRYSSQAAMETGKRRVLRPRVMLYPLLLAILGTALVLVFHAKGTADVTLLRNFGNPYTRLGDGMVSNSFRIKITNRLRQAADYHISVINLPTAQVLIDENPLHVTPETPRTEGLAIVLPQKEFHLGAADVTLRVSDGQGFSRDLAWRLLGPQLMDSAAPNLTGGQTHEH